jgi:glycosyltransferase involved in cell wall biosynthesis
MRIAYVAAGAAGMYCGTCLHDNAVAAALLARGHEVALVPTYTPLRTDEPDVSVDRLFYGAVNVYLQQKSALFRRTPAWLDRLFDRRALLARIGRLAGSTDALDLGALTLSVVRGEDGQQGKELARLVAWLGEFRPDLVQLTNSMFLGFAPAIKRRLGDGVPVVCGLTGEDLFLDALVEPFRGQVLAELRRLAGGGGAADAFIATSRYYADLMAPYLGVERRAIHVVPPGIDLRDYPAAGAGAAGSTAANTAPARSPDPAPGTPADADRPFTVGYLARIAPEKGLHLLLDAFRLLAADAGPGSRSGARPARLRVAGYLGPRHRGYLDEQRARAAGWGLGDAVDIVGEVDRAGKLAFLAGLDVLSVPSPYREPKGRFVLEALAHGVPVVQPDHGAYPELIASTGGGLLVEPGSPAALAEGLRRLRDDPALRRQLGTQGRAAVRQRYHAGVLADRTLEVYRAAVERAAEGGRPAPPAAATASA